jgi:plasmid maintenance system antidote protein VapI
MKSTASAPSRSTLRCELGRSFGQSPRFWLNVQTECDLRNAKQLVERVAREVHPFTMAAA